MVSYQEIGQFVVRHEKQMFSLLKDMVLVQSGSYNKSGIDKLVHLIADFFVDLAFPVREIPEQNLGNHLLVSTEGCVSKDRSILVTGHTDTVYPEDTSFNWFKEDDEKVYGPGVIDMKGGLVVGMFALKALHEFELSEVIPVKFLFNSDEEIGSPGSQKIIRDLARRSLFGFVLECGGLDNSVVTGRKGKIGLRIQVKGGAGHAAFASTGKPSAILELAHKIIKIEKLNQLSEGISVNVGKVSGGTRPNVVARDAEALIDIRYMREEQRESILSRLEDIVKKPFLGGVSGKLEIISERPPMPRTEGNKKVYGVIQEVGKKLGIDIQEDYRNGVSDANLMAAEGLPVVDGLGPVGDLDHSEKEYMIKNTLPERTALFIATLIESWNRRNELSVVDY